MRFILPAKLAFDTISRIFQTYVAAKLIDHLNDATMEPLRSILTVDLFEGTDQMQACDFSRSFLTFRVDTKVQPAVTKSHQSNHTANNARIQLDCLCELTSPNSSPVQYVLGASCKSEYVNVDENVWTQPNSDFCLTVSHEHFLIIKHYDHCGQKVMLYPPSLGEQPHRQSGLVKDAYAKLSIDVCRAPGQLLETMPQIMEAAFAKQPLVAVTQFVTDDGYNVRLEYPVKTINIGDRELFYQTDTGPVLYPEQPSRSDLPIESFQLAYIAANSPDWAELLLDVPTPVSTDTTVLHYSKPLRINCQNALIALN